MTKKEEFQNKLNLKRGELFTVLGEYIDNKTNIKIRCNKCGYVWNPKPMTLTRNNKPIGCPNCNENYHPKSNTDNFKKLVYSLVKDEYSVLGEYKNSSTKILMKHNKCGHEYTVKPNDFQQGYRCPFCSHGHRLKTQKEFEEEVYNITNGEYIVTGKYNGTSKKVKFKHNDCGKEFEMIARNFLSNGNRCPHCKSYKGELLIENILIKNKIPYIKQKSYDDLYLKNKLRFDFKIKNKKFLIEYDGRLHFEHRVNPNKIYNKSNYFIDEDFCLQRFRDSLKNRYCMLNGLSLLRIDYTNFDNIEEILLDIFKNKERSTTIKKYNLYYIYLGKLINDNNKYDVLNYK